MSAPVDMQANEAAPASDLPRPERTSWRFPVACAAVVAAGLSFLRFTVPSPGVAHASESSSPASGAFIPDASPEVAAAFGGVNPHALEYAAAPLFKGYEPPLPQNARVRIGSMTVSGRLPPEVVGRILRRNTGRARQCYQGGLQQNPNLIGRVVVRFVIGRDGAVSHVGNGGSDLPDGGVISCVVRSFHGLVFPQPDRGIVTVSYPLMFSPG